MKSSPRYAELHCLSAFSFGRGASTADELFERAKKLNYTALAITDECSLAGIVRAFEASRKHEIPLIVGSELSLDEGLKLVVLVEDHTGYSGLCALITKARRRAVKGSYHVTRDDLKDGLPGCVLLWCPGESIDPEQGAWMRATFGDRVWLAVELHRGPDDATRLEALLRTADALQLPAVACGDVHMHVRRRRALQDVLTALRHRLSVAEAGAYLFANGERHLRTLAALQQIYPQALLDETQRIAARCGFRMDQLNYRYPRELVPDGHTPASWLRQLTEAGMQRRWPEGVLPKVRQQIESELVLIAELQYEAFFLTVEDVVRFARSRGILCQGRGSSANSAVCFALGITEVDPARMNLLFGRFLSKERNEPPDIDVDFEHDRREEVIQYLYAKYGRARAALAATVICYRGKSAIRDVSRALDLPPDLIDQLSRAFAWWNGESDPAERVRERGFDPESPVLRRVLALTRELLDMPRHLSQHVGGFVIADAPLSSLVPVENATMPERTIIQWDKDDLETLGLLKVDVLALGMLSAVRRCFELVEKHRGYTLTMATVPAEDAATYAMIQRADTVGVFQIESRAQMAMLPRLKPATFYDLVIEVAIVRPGPIQGNMVHPYLRRRQQQEPVRYPSEGMRDVLGRTLGVPLFQEQVMQLAIVAADFSAGEADALRRGMAAWKRHGGLEHFRQRLFDGMARNGYPESLAEQLFEQIKGFGSYGFPESHAASFALITYVSCWLKCHEPAAFTCALLNSQPMGFYAPSQLIQDVRRHGVVVRPVDVRYSDWDSTLEDASDRPASHVSASNATVSEGPDHGRTRVHETRLTYHEQTRRAVISVSEHAPRRRHQPAIRLGLREIAGLAEDAARRIMLAREHASFADVADLCIRAELDQRARSLLAEAGALRGLAGHRHRARWAIAGVEPQLPLFADSPKEDAVSLRVPTVTEDLNADFARLGHTLGPHPVQLLRCQLQARRYRRSRDLTDMQHGRPVRVAGLVTGRQRPQTATGVTFVTLEDEDGMVNVVVWRDLGDRQRRVLIESRLLGVAGRLETVDGVQHLIAGRLFDESDLLGGLTTRSRDFH